MAEVGHAADDLDSALLTEDHIFYWVAALAGEIADDLAGRDRLLVGMLGGAFTVDVARAFARQAEVS